MNIKMFLKCLRLGADLVFLSQLRSWFYTTLMCSCFPRMQRERAELEQNFAREISNLVQRLSAEKDQLEAELKLKMDQEVMLVRWVVTSQLALR